MKTVFLVVVSALLYCASCLNPKGNIFNVDEFKKGVMERVNKEVEEAKSKGNTTGANQIGISLSVGI